jgi:hypothetical protein
MTKDRMKRPPTKPERLQDYRMSLSRKRVSSTVRQAPSTFDDTTSYPMMDTAWNVPGDRINVPQQARWAPLVLKILAIALPAIFIMLGAVYKFGMLEKGVEYIQKGLSDMQDRVTKIEDEHRKDYRELDEKINSHFSRSTK